MLGAGFVLASTSSSPSMGGNLTRGEAGAWFFLYLREGHACRWVRVGKRESPSASMGGNLTRGEKEP
jgi:hypothetical protein